MSTDIIRLGAGDFDEAMDFLNLVFGEHFPHDFANMLPGIYQPTDEHMRCNYAVREGGRLGAIVGVFPIRWRVGDVTLKVAGVGGVSVHPESRGRGYMKLLMQHAVAEMRREGYDMSYLGGRRQRYAYFGYEVAGTTYRVNFNADNVRHTTDSDTPGLTFEPARDDHATNAALKTLHDAQIAYCERPVEAFHRYLRSWHCRPMVAKEADGRIVGYLSAQLNEPVLNEFVAQDAPTAARMVRAWVAEKSDKATVVLRMPAEPVLRELHSFAESLHLFHAGNYQVFDWVKVLDALLKAQHAANRLPEGRVLLGIEDAGQTMRLVVDGDNARCEATDEKPCLKLDGRLAVRVLFSLGGPASVIELPPWAAILSAWCPLPMGFSLQDHV
jgi:predicted acetyltransferase